MTVCHAFQSAGTYAVGLQVTDEMGANDQDAVSITVNPPANHPPVANPTATPNTGDAPLMVVFAANASDPDNDPLGYLWDFGDPASGSENTSTLANPSHIYDQAGTYNVWLTVSDGKTSPAPSYLLTVTVEPEITLSVRLAIILYLNKQKTMGSVTLWADLDTDKPATDDVVTVWMDGVRLFSLPFGAFKKGILPGAYVYIGNGLLVRLDLANHRMLVMTPKMDVSRIDNSNGVDVEVMVGNAMVVEKIRLTAAQMNTLIYRRKGVQGDPQ
jgi:PKD repeat protein